MSSGKSTENAALLERERETSRLAHLKTENAERRGYEAAFRESEDRWRKLLDLSLDAVYLQVDGRFVHLNPAMAKLLGEPSSRNLIDKPVSDFIDPSLREKARDRMIGVLEKQETARPTEQTFVRPDGIAVHTEVIEAPVVFGGRKATQVIVRDLTDRRRAEESLRLSEERYRTLIQTMDEGFAIVDEMGVIGYANKRLTEIIGYSMDELAGRSVSEFFDQADKDAFSGEFFALGNKEGQVRFEVEFTAKGGRKVPAALSCTAQRDREGAFKGAFVTATNLVEEKRAKSVLAEVRKELAKSFGQRPAGPPEAAPVIPKPIPNRRGVDEYVWFTEERFRAVFEGVRDCVCIKDAARRLTHVNSAMERLFGVSRAQLVGKKAEDLFGIEAGGHVRDIERRVLKGETVEEEHMRPVNGVMLTFQDALFPLRDKSGEVVGICAISRNVTDPRRVRPEPLKLVREYPSEAMRATMAEARQAANKDGIVLLLGDSGSGKDHMARWIHGHSKRAGGPFFSINCAAVPAELAESELFGHEAGAFTGARSRKKGLLELAGGGTLLLNEIGELSTTLQAKLLTFLDERAFLRVGGEKSIRINARIIAATHRDLWDEVGRGHFLRALYYRLNVFAIELPTLRKRIKDLPVLVEEIISKLVTDMQLSEVPSVDSTTMDALSRYPWPGNVRELRNVLERALMLSDGPRLNLALPQLPVPDTPWSYQLTFPDLRTLHDVTDDVTRALCEEALRRVDGNKKAAAELLGISRYSLYRHLRYFGIEGENVTDA